jgi:octanoyl-[GcvH]:protein N-octanoyltransferase
MHDALGPDSELIVSSAPIDGPPELDHGISRALLARVAAGELPSALRIWTPAPALALSRLDLLRPRVSDAIGAAERAGVSPIRRLSGGHAVLLGSGSLCAGFAEPATAFEGTRERYERLSAAIVGALAALGVAAEQGDLEGEWCPGTWSIRSGGAKLAGLAQRAVKGAAWVEAVLQLAPANGSRELLAHVYELLRLDLDPATLGSVAEARGGAVRFDDFAAPLAAELGAASAAQTSPSRATMERAAGFSDEFEL